MGFIPILDSYQKPRTLIPVMNVMSRVLLLRDDANPPKMSSVMNMSSFIFYVLRQASLSRIQRLLLGIPAAMPLQKFRSSQVLRLVVMAVFASRT